MDDYAESRARYYAARVSERAEHIARCDAIVDGEEYQAELDRFDEIEARLCEEAFPGLTVIRSSELDGLAQGRAIFNTCTAVWLRERYGDRAFHVMGVGFFLRPAAPVSEPVRPAIESPDTMSTMDRLPVGIMDRKTVAAMIGIAPESLSRYLVRGDGPVPDGYIGGSPWWQEITVVTWLEQRPGRTGRPPRSTESTSAKPMSSEPRSKSTRAKPMSGEVEVSSKSKPERRKTRTDSTAVEDQGKRGSRHDDDGASESKPRPRRAKAS